MGLDNIIHILSSLPVHPVSLCFSLAEFNASKDSPLLVLRILTTDNVDVLPSLPFHTLATVAELLH
jgi:hypothetical protein